MGRRRLVVAPHALTGQLTSEKRLFSGPSLSARRRGSGHCSSAGSHKAHCRQSTPRKGLALGCSFDCRTTLRSIMGRRHPPPSCGPLLAWPAPEVAKFERAWSASTGCCRPSPLGGVRHETSLQVIPQGRPCFHGCQPPRGPCASPAVRAAAARWWLLARLAGLHRAPRPVTARCGSGPLDH
jgi:hypothetical protein